MRLLHSQSEEVTRLLTAPERLYVRDLLADFPVAVAGSMAIVVLALIASTFAKLAVVAAFAGVALLVWIGFFVWKNCLDHLNWIVAVTPQDVLIRIYRRIGPLVGDDTEADVLGLASCDVTALSPGQIDIMWSSIRHTRIKCAFIEPSIATDTAETVFAKVQDFHGYGCGVSKHRTALARDNYFIIDWTGRRPRLEAFIRAVSANFPNVRIGNAKSVVLDLRDFVIQPEAEQHSTLLFLKQLGFDTACAIMLKQRMRMSAADAARVMNNL